jgi:glycosyltransferase involved in cell wall biosynthesis
MKVSILAATCTIHSLARPRLLARLLEEAFEVEVVAPVFPGDIDVYEGSRWPGTYTPVPVRPFPGFARSAGDLLDALTGDVIYACKPKATSFGVALWGKRRLRKPVVVDVDDREIFLCYPYSSHVSKNLLFSAREWANPNAYPLTLALDRLAHRAEHVTTVSRHYQRRFGGTIIPQAVDADFFCPDHHDRQVLRQEWGLDQFRVVLFLGRPQPHKGLEEILRAVSSSSHPEVRLVIAPPLGGPSPYTESLRGHERVIVLDPEPFEKCPALLAMSDVVMVPQRINPISMGQMPTKIPEAMAMGIPVIATDVADIREQVGEGGLIVPPGDVGALTDALDQLLDDESLARRLGQAGRERAANHYSLTAVRPTMEGVFARYAA